MLKKAQTRVDQSDAWVVDDVGGRVAVASSGDWWTTVRDWAGAALPAQVQARLARAHAQLGLLEMQMAELDAQQQAAVTAAPRQSPLRQLVRLKGVAATSASVLLDEGLVWRAFRNRREVGRVPGVHADAL